MKKIIIIIYLLVFTLNIYSQTYKAIYKIKYNNSNSDSKKTDTLNEKTKMIFAKMERKKNDAINLSEKIDLILNFDQKASFFYLPKILENQKGTMNSFRRITGIRGAYYSNSKKTIESKNSYGEDFLVNIPKFKWVITNESKKIGNYTCYKAKTERVIKNSRGIFHRPIIAWFAPELQFNFGPKEFNGLPGLIIHLQQGRKLFYLSSIKRINNLKIEEPKKGKKITLEQFDNLSKKMYESINSNR